MKQYIMMGAVAAFSAAIGATAAIALDPNGPHLMQATNKIQGGGPYNHMYFAGDPTLGEAGSFVIERNGQRPGNSTDDGPAFVVRSKKHGAARFDGGVEVVKNAANVLPMKVVHNGVKNTSGSKRQMAIQSVGGVEIRGKLKTGAPQLANAKIWVEGDTGRG